MMIYDSLMRLTSGRVQRTAFLLSYLATLFPPLSVFHHYTTGVFNEARGCFARVIWFLFFLFFHRDGHEHSLLFFFNVYYIVCV